VKPPVGVAIALAVCSLIGGSASAVAGAQSKGCGAGEVLTAPGCTGFRAAGRHVEAIVRESVEENDLRAALVRVDVGNRTLATASPGESMAGAPANLRMHFRIGSIAIPDLIDLLLQLQDRGRLSLDDPVSKWFPDLPNADRVTLRMLANSTSGYADWVQGNDEFSATLLDDVFRQWKTRELLDIALARPLVCAPGACFHYAHTNFVILDKVIHEVTGQSIAKLTRRRIFRPLGLRQTKISALPAIPSPALHAYSGDRGVYEDSTSWSPSWGIAAQMTQTSTIGDVMKMAKALGEGALISKRASRERFAPTTASLPNTLSTPFSPNYYYGLGVLVLNSWEFQNPQLNGYTSIMAYMPSRRIAVALTVTNGRAAAATQTNFSERLFTEISAYLTPDHLAAP